MNIQFSMNLEITNKDIYVYKECVFNETNDNDLDLNKKARVTLDMDDIYKNELLTLPSISGDLSGDLDLR